MMDFEKFCSLLSDYIDKELDRDLREEINEMLCEDSSCEHLMNTLLKTVDMYRGMEMLEVPEETHEELLLIIKREIHSEED